MIPQQRILAAVCCLAVLGCSVGAEEKEDGFTSLFDGESLEGWHGDEALWTVEDGEILGVTDGEIPDNTFLISDGEYANFVLKLKFRLHDHQGNSGIQFRSKEVRELNGKEFPEFVVAGYQADIASERYMGILYGEKTGRGIIHDVTEDVVKKLEEAVVKDVWNEYVITADGDHIRQELNGVTTVDIEDPEGDKKGVIALQLHRGHNMRISFKDIFIKELD